MGEKKSKSKTSDKKVFDRIKKENDTLKDKIAKILKTQNELNDLIKKKDSRIKKLEKSRNEMVGSLDEIASNNEDFVKLQKDHEALTTTHNKLKKQQQAMMDDDEGMAKDMEALKQER